jgi:hypothetical protein
MKDTDAGKINALEDQVRNESDAEADELIKAADQKKDKSSGDQREEEFRIWRCQGVSIGLHIHKKKP